MGAISDYQHDILQYVGQRELECKIDGKYVGRSNLISAKLRLYLVRHMFKLYKKFDLLRTTLHLAVLYLDLYCSKQVYFKDQMEIISTAQACMFIAMKY